MSDESTPAIDEYGNKRWINTYGKYDRLDGPAIILLNGYKAWYVNGIVHREDGPAIVKSDGVKEWCLNGILYKTKESYFDALSDEAKAKCLFSEDFLNG